MTQAFLLYNSKYSIPYSRHIETSIDVIFVHTIQVNSVGVLSVDSPVTSANPQPFPGSQRVIAPYWAPVNLSRGGQVYYRVTNDSALLEQAQEHILELFPDLQDLFEPLQLLVVTWYKVMEADGGNEVST